MLTTKFDKHIPARLPYLFIIMKIGKVSASTLLPIIVGILRQRDFVKQDAFDFWQLITERVRSPWIETATCPHQSAAGKLAIEKQCSEGTDSINLRANDQWLHSDGRSNGLFFSKWRAFKKNKNTRKFELKKIQVVG